MKIGIDLDNTIIDYENIFIKTAKVNKFIFQNSKILNKKDLKKTILRKRSIETWQLLQGIVYGKKIKNAQIMSNFISFIKTAEIFDCEIFIVSHKTKYGHYLNKKINLQTEAYKWIKFNLIENNKLKIIKKKNIYFCESLREKVNQINKLDLDIFIDDLPKVVNHTNLSKKILKILLNKDIDAKNIEVINFKNWLSIKNFLFNNFTTKNIKNLLIKSNFKKNLNFKNIKKISHSINSKTYLLHQNNGKKFIMKIYLNQLNDFRNRIKQEINAYNLLNKNNIHQIPKIIYSSESYNFIILEYINGSNFTKIADLDLIDLLDFLKQLKKITSRNYNIYPFDASEATFNFKDLSKNLNNRIKNLLTISKNYKILDKFLKFELIPKWKKINKNLIINHDNKISVLNLNKKNRILSPSDFGFQNMIKYNGKIFFMDFEYFGMDDPVKLVSDFILHPKNNLTKKQIKIWIDENSKMFIDDKYFNLRLKLYLPIFTLFC